MLEQSLRRGSVAQRPCAPALAPRRLAAPVVGRQALQPARIAYPSAPASSSNGSPSGAPSPSPHTNGKAAAAAADHNAPAPAPAGVVPATTYTATLLLQCPDQKGVIAAVSQLLYGFGCNIVSSDQFTDMSCNMFFQRITFDYSDIVIGPGNAPILERAVAELANRYQIKWKLAYKNKVKRVALLVSKLDHCLYDLLIRHRSGELSCTIPIIISNHPTLQHIADMFGVPWACLPLDKNNKEAQEAQLEQLLQENDIDVIVLARYMQIFTQGFCERHAHRTINIHHSFLPAFEGGRPYHRAHERGVKIIGATAHFATAELDAGPIIDQGVTRITHRDGVEDMIRKGRDLERLVLARALRWHLDDRVLVFNNKTVVFED